MTPMSLALEVQGIVPLVAYRELALHQKYVIQPEREGVPELGLPKSAAGGVRECPAEETGNQWGRRSREVPGYAVQHQ